MMEGREMTTDNKNAGKLHSFNGVDGTTGNYLLPPLTAREIAMIAAGETFSKEEIDELRLKWFHQKNSDFRPMAGIDPEDLSQAGWGVIFAPDVTDEEKKALSPLLDLRKEQAGALYKDFREDKAYRPVETKNAFLIRQGIGPGVPIPEIVPYYLLIVGSPESIPYRFQYQLDVQYAVGRIHFDSPQEYAAYAASVVKADRGESLRPRRVSFFGVRNPDDAATALSADELIKPLCDVLKHEEPSWDWRCLLADETQKAKLGDLLGGPETPSLVFSASHGMGFPNGHPQQLSHQGALLCQNWPGRLKHHGPIPEDFYFSGADVAEDADLQGLIAFFFACYGAGTPHSDDFSYAMPGAPAEIAPVPFVAALPKKLLCHQKGGALAVIGHVERAWTYSFMWEQAGSQIVAFRSALKELVNGKRIGFAMESFNSKYAELSTELTDELQNHKFWKPKSPSETLIKDEELAGMWTANNDARSYIVLGDPAVRLAVNIK
jgi:hypothetical protein